MSFSLTLKNKLFIIKKKFIRQKYTLISCALIQVKALISNYLALYMYFIAHSPLYFFFYFFI